MRVGMQFSSTKGTHTSSAIFTMTIYSFVEKELIFNDKHCVLKTELFGS
jgi:hypothetical protein